MQDLEGHRVAVVFGGRSVEHEVSILTAHQVMAVLEPRHHVIPVYVSREGIWYTGPRLQNLRVYDREAWSRAGRRCWILPEANSRALTLAGGRFSRSPQRIDVDIAVPAIHGTFGEDGTLQGLLELAGIPYTGSGVTASALGMDKVAMRAAFVAAGLRLPDAVTVDARDISAPAGVVARIESALARAGRGPYPLFVKPASCGSSVGVGKATDTDTLVLALRNASRFDSQLLVEQAAENYIEVNCSVLGNGQRVDVSVCEQPVAGEAEFLTYSVKYGGGFKTSKAVDAGLDGATRRIPAPIDHALTEKVRQAAAGAFRAVGAEGVARVDCFVDESSGDVLLGEINTVPGSFSWYLWQESGLNFADLMDRLLMMGLQRHALKMELELTPAREPVARL